jgi:anaerobic selenocysteine-containing dehydrogenase
VPSHMASIARMIMDGRLDVLLTAGTDMLNSFSDAGAIERDLERVGLIVAYDIFANDTTRRVADIVLPGTVWLEDLGIKETATHLYLMDRALESAGECRPLIPVLRDLAERLSIEDFFPWGSLEAYMDALLTPQQGGALTVARLRELGGMAERSRLSHVPYREGGYATPSGKVEFYSERAAGLGLPPLPVFEPLPASSFPLTFRQGRTLTQFHGFYDHGRALPTLAKADPEPRLWISTADAKARSLDDGVAIRIFNERGELRARALVTPRIPAGAVWMRDGWEGLNGLTSGRSCIPDEAVGLFPFAAGQAAFDAMVEVEAV